MIKKKFIALIAVLFAAALFVSCGGEDSAATNNDAQNNTQGNASAAGDNPGEDETDMSLTPELPDIQFDGYTFNILNTENESVTWLLTQLESEEETGDLFNDKVYRRNRRIEERYNITIKETLVTNLDAVNSAAQRIIRAGGEDYDLYLMNHNHAFTLAQNGSLIDYKSIPHIDLNKKYWDQDMIRDISIGGRLFVMSGDFNYTPYSATIVMFFNKKMLLDYQLDDPYALVRDGKWTFDAFHGMAKQVSADLDGNGRYDKNDQYGYMSLNFLLNPAFISASGEKFLSKDSEDKPYLTVGNEKFINVYHKILEIMHDGNLLYDADASGRDHRDQDDMFPGNQVLFWSELMNWAKILRDMEADFGILPHPKYEESQDRYYSIVFGPTFMAVPSTTRDLERTGIIL